ncbi:MAG TPA: hypothetical protein VFR68_00280 [Candidatus Dormibacteraeota bacterium]|nr:hypothetical protein [Candidatus Dormibacteraeota bacterium]
MKIQPSRPLNNDERAILNLLLQPEFEGVEQLRGQADRAQVVSRCDCGCPTINIDVPEDMPSAAISGRLSPVELRVVPEGSDAPGEIIIFPKDGRLSSMEYVYYTRQPPEQWPTPDRLTTVELAR